MRSADGSIRVLYSFPHRIGAGRICTTAWHQVDGAAAAGAHLLVFPGSLHRAFSESVEVAPTLARGNFRIPYKVIGARRACRWHDWIVARRLKELANTIDIIHAWPQAALSTIRAARTLGIPTVLERPNAHTEYAFEAVRIECERLGMIMPAGHDHAFNADVLALETAEFREADGLLCPSEFVVGTFLERGFSGEKLLRHQYGYDGAKCYPAPDEVERGTKGLAVLFAGECSPRKGLHYALASWLASPASRSGTFTIAGEFVAEYLERLSGYLAHPSVHMLGQRDDIPELMRRSDVLVLPSVEEGSALVTAEARGCGCVLLVSSAAGAMCRHFENALVHTAGDGEALTRHFTILHEDRSLLKRLRTASLLTSADLTWAAAGKTLLSVYQTVIDKHSARSSAGRPGAVATTR